MAEAGNRPVVFSTHALHPAATAKLAEAADLRIASGPMLIRTGSKSGKGRAATGMA